MGSQKKVGKAFEEILAVCASPTVNRSLDKYRIVLASPMRDELPAFCNTGAGMEIFTLNMAYEMSLSGFYTVSTRIE